jgi:para-nitrobenzyl esterase
MPTITTDAGPLQVNAPGTNGIRTFMGIPYAAPPVGDLRWRPPKPVTPWNSSRSTDAFGPNALQGIVFPDIDPFAVGVSEDCLYLNIWTPAEPGDNAKLPVFFWIHGGGFAVGSGSEPRYNGAALAAKGIVVVTINHRLNALGFLAHPALREESVVHATGNYAPLDVIAALHWVKTNIAGFGGDPGCVTIGGESAGSMMVSMMMASPLAKGLFHRAIGQSGAEFPSPEKRTQTLAEAEAFGLKFAKKLGAKTAKDLRNVSAKKILEASPGLGFWPVIDGEVLPQNLPTLFALARHSDVPLLAGLTKDEGTNFNVLKRGKKTLDDWLKITFGKEAKTAEKFYPLTDPRASGRSLGGDLVINHGAHAWMEAHRATGQADIFRYRFDKAPNTDWFPKDPNPGTFHSCDIPYVFNTLKAMPWATDAADQTVADLTVSYWVNFITRGNPNGQGLPQWPSYREANRPVLTIDVTPRVLDNPDAERHAYLAQFCAKAPPTK